MSKCVAKKTDGSQCNSPALLGSDYCFMHNPETKLEADKARLLGGKNRKVVAIGEYPGDITTIAGLLEFANAAMREAWNLEGSERRLRAVTSLLRVATQILPLVDLDQRMKILEGVLYGSSRRDQKPN